MLSVKLTRRWRQNVGKRIWKMKNLKAIFYNQYNTSREFVARIFSVKSFSSLASNQEGSIIIIALMVLVIMTVIGLISSDTVVTENFIIRNQGIYKQNVNMVESAMMEGYQTLMQTPNDELDVDASTTDWLLPISPSLDNEWYQLNQSELVLDENTAMNIITPQPLVDRGENGESNLLVSFVGWETLTYAEGGSGSLVTGPGFPAEVKEGRILGEYISRDTENANNGFGMLRMEMGVRQFVIDM